MMYLHLVVGLRWWWVCSLSWRWTIIWILIWILITTIGLCWVLILIFIIISSCGTWIGTTSSCTILLAVICGVGMILRQLHGLLLGIGVHQASFVVVAVVVIIVVIIVDLHKLEQVLWLLGFLLLGLLLRMLDRVRRPTGALASDLPGPGHL
jgi:hypothetical protein